MNILFLFHIAFAYTSLALLLTRGLLSARKVNWRQYKSLRILPHIIDTLLLLSGFTIFVGFGFSMLQTWIWSKFLFIVLYVFFSIKAFKENDFSIKHFILAVISFCLAMAVVTFR